MLVRWERGRGTWAVRKTAQVMGAGVLRFARYCSEGQLGLFRAVHILVQKDQSKGSYGTHLVAWGRGLLESLCLVHERREMAVLALSSECREQQAVMG